MDAHTVVHCVFVHISVTVFDTIIAWCYVILGTTAVSASAAKVELNIALKR